VQPELKAVLQPYGADRVSACGARAAGVLSGAWLVGWCSARAPAAVRCGREGLSASAGAHLSGRRRNAGALRFGLGRVGRAAAWVGTVEARKGGANWSRRCCSRMLELTQPTRTGTTRHATIGVGFTDASVCGCEWRRLPTIVRLGVDLPLWLGLMVIGVMGMGTVACRCRSAQWVGVGPVTRCSPRRAARNMARVPT
jgi:hypothetical protein